jgi:hypothetical protein
MSMLAFFPWLEIEGRIRFGEYELVPFKREREPSGSGSEEQKRIDSVLHPFKLGQSAHGPQPVNVATIMRLAERELLKDFSECELDSLFMLALLVAFGGLAAREFCGVAGVRYCNATDFTFMVQSFREEANGTVIDIPRRDGLNSIRITADAYQAFRPFHASTSFGGVRLDAPLIEALLRASRGHTLWDRLRDSLTAFVRANTDNPEIARQSEVVDTVGAFERLLDVRGSDKLKREFESHFRPGRDIKPQDAPRIPPALRNGPSLRCLWIADFYKHRNPHAHGAQSTEPGRLWDRAEHLLLAAYAFPLLVKSLLSEAGLYSLIAEDQEAIDAFEWIAETKDHLLSRNARGQPGWQAAQADFHWAPVMQATEREGSQ